MEFLPDDYVEPNMSSNYMKFKEGENKFRILSRPVIGYEDWQDKKPIRYEKTDTPPKPLDPIKLPKLYWAFIVWNYDEKRIQILQITQVSIRKSILTLSKDESWGAPFFYDLKVIRSGKGKETEYAVNPVPPKQLDPEVRKAFDEKKCNLEVFVRCEDPFASWPSYTEGVFEKKSVIVEIPIPEKKIEMASKKN